MASVFEIFTPIDISSCYTDCETDEITNEANLCDSWRIVSQFVPDEITPSIFNAGICADYTFSDNTPFGIITDCIHAGQLLKAARNGEMENVLRQYSMDNMIHLMRSSVIYSIPDVTVTNGERPAQTSLDFYASKILEISRRPQPGDCNIREFMEVYYPRWCEQFADLAQIPYISIASPLQIIENTSNHQQCYNHIYNCLMYSEMFNYIVIEPLLDPYNGKCCRKFLSHIHYHLAEYFSKKVMLYYPYR